MSLSLKASFVLAIGFDHCIDHPNIGKSDRRHGHGQPEKRKQRRHPGDEDLWQGWQEVSFFDLFAFSVLRGWCLGVVKGADIPQSNSSNIFKAPFVHLSSKFYLSIFSSNLIVVRFVRSCVAAMSLAISFKWGTQWFTLEMTRFYSTIFRKIIIGWNFCKICLYPVSCSQNKWYCSNSLFCILYFYFLFQGGESRVVWGTPLIHCIFHFLFRILYFVFLGWGMPRIVWGTPDRAGGGHRGSGGGDR